MCVDCVALSLDGTLRHTDGVLPMVSIAKRHGIETVYVPYEDAPEAGLVESALSGRVARRGAAAVHS